MPPAAPLHQLPDRVSLDLRETGLLLASLDAAIDAGVPSAVERRLVAGVQIVTSKLWPELGRLLDNTER